MFRRRAFDDEPPPPKAPPRPRRKRRPRPGAAAPGHARWLVAYADFITRLFAVFATMYALSAVDANKYAAMAASLQQAFRTAKPDAAGSGEALLVRPADAKVGFMPPAGSEVSLDDVRTRLQGRLAPVIESNLVSLETDQRGLVVTLREAGAFPLSSADLSEVAQIILREIGTALAEVGNHVRIEGHTDDIPIRTARFASNWELSTARATTVVRFLLDHTGLRPDRLSAAGYAEYFPRVPNTDPAARARNRRVDLVILSPQTRAAQEPPERAAEAPATPVAPADAAPASEAPGPPAAAPAAPSPAQSSGGR